MKETNDLIAKTLDGISRVEFKETAIIVDSTITSAKALYEQGIAFDTIAGIQTLPTDKPVDKYIVQVTNECISLLKDMIKVMKGEVTVDITPINRLALIKLETHPYSFIQLSSPNPTDIITKTITVVKTSEGNDPLKEGDRIIVDRSFFIGDKNIPSPMELGMLPKDVYPYTNVVIADKLRRLKKYEHAIVNMLIPYYKTIEFATIDFHYIRAIVG